MHHHGEMNQRTSNNVSSSSLILFTLTMEAIRSSETLVLARATRLIS
jgi:hypothetical protein